jgi:hypothetical protein
MGMIPFRKGEPSMQSSIRFRFFAMAVTLAASLFVLFTPAARGQKGRVASDPVLAQGNPPLTESMVTRFTDFQAWLFEIPFTQQQRERIRAMLLQDWKKPEEIKSDMSWLTMEADFAKGAPDVREFMRLELEAKVLKDLRADKTNPDSQWLVAAYDDAHRPIAAGNPPLTESMVSHYSFFIAWLLEIPLAQPLKDRLRAMLLEDWKKPKEIETDMKTLNWQLEMARDEKGEVQRLYERSVLQPDIVRQMRADKGNPDSQALVGAYDAAHQSIVAGNPPLTRQASDAWTELFCFIRNQSGAPHMDATPAVKDDVAHTLRENWTTYPPEQQKALSEMSQTWALVHFAWVRNKGDERQKIMAAWQPVVNPGASGDPQQVAATDAMARAYAFTKRDANTVTDQELLEAAKDVDLVASQYRRMAGPENLGKAAQWEDLARLMRAGKAEYLKRAEANTQAGQNAIVEEYLKTQLMIKMLHRPAATLSLDGKTMVMRSR